MLQERFCQKGYTDYLVGTVEAKPGTGRSGAPVEQGSYERVVLVPLMMVAGDHANNDMQVRRMIPGNQPLRLWEKKWLF